VSTQLRLVETLAEPSPRRRTADRSARGAVPRTPRARTTAVGRRAASWGEWHLDARTRRVGRAGVAAARRALERATPEEAWSQAS